MRRLQNIGTYIGQPVDRFHKYTDDPVFVELGEIYVQPDNYSCGATSLKTLMKHYGQETDLGQLLAMTQTTEKGTPIGSLASTAECFGFQTEVMADAQIDDLRRNLRQGRIPLVGHMVNDERIPEPHYSLVVGVTDNEVLVADSRTGSVYKKAVDFFLREWTEDRPPRTMLVIFRSG